MKNFLIVVLISLMLPMAAYSAGSTFSFSIFSQQTGTTTAVTGSTYTLPETMTPVTCEITTYPTTTTSVSLYGGGGIYSGTTVTFGATALAALDETVGHLYSTLTITYPIKFLMPIVTTPTITTSTVNILCVGK